MKKMMLTISLMLLIASCSPLTLTDGTMLDGFIDTAPALHEVEDIRIDGDDWEIRYSADGYYLDNVRVIGIMDGEEEIDITDDVAFVTSGSSSLTLSYGGVSKTIMLEKPKDDIVIHIDPETIYYGFFMPDEFPEEDSVFVGWRDASSMDKKPLDFPIVNYDPDKTDEKSGELVISPIYRPLQDVFSLDSSGSIAGVKEDYAFYGIPKSVTAIGKSAFEGNKTVRAVAFEKGSAATLIDEMAFYFSSLQYIGIPSSVEMIAPLAFDGAVDMKQVIFEEDSSLTTIGHDAFSVLNMKEFTIPRSVRTIERSAFGMDVYLERIIFEEGTEIQYIDPYAFDNDFSLRSIEFHSPKYEIPAGYETGWGAPFEVEITVDGVPL